MSIYKEFISTLIEKLVDLGYLKEKPIGEDIKYINKIERHFKIKLPELYKELILQMGFSMPGDGNACYFCLDINNKFDTQRTANKVLKYDKSKHYPLKNKLVIVMDCWYLFDFIPTDCGDNPPVYRYYSQYGNKETLELYSSKDEERIMYEALYGIEISKIICKYLYNKNGEIHYESFSEYIIFVIYNTIRKLNEGIYAEIKPFKDDQGWVENDGGYHNYTAIQNKEEYIKKEETIRKEFEYISTELRKIIPKNFEVK